MSKAQKTKRPTLAARLKACEAEKHQLGIEVRRLRGVIGALAGSGLVPASFDLYGAGYRKGSEDALEAYRGAVQEHHAKVVEPTIGALMDLRDTIAGAAGAAGVFAIRRADARDELRPYARTIAYDLYKRFHDVEAALTKTGEKLPEVVRQEVIQFHEALMTFASGADDGQALAECRAVQDTIAGEISATLAGLQMGRPTSEARAWIGQRIEKLRAEHRLSYPDATARLYRELIAKQHARELLAVEEAALAKLDELAEGIYRDYGNLPSRVIDYCRKVGHEHQRRRAQSGK